jgi:hypothetical protein
MSKKAKKDNSTEGKLKNIDPNFLDEVMGMSSDELKSRIVLIAKHVEEIKTAKEQDDDLKRMKEQVKVAGETYSEPLKAASLKTKFIIELLLAKGQ